MLKHIVMWKLNGDEAQRAAVIKEFTEKTEYLKTIIPEILEAAVGANINGGDAFHVCIDSMFNNAAELNAYIEHPEHLKVRKLMTEASYDKAVFDYEF